MDNLKWNQFCSCLQIVKSEDEVDKYQPMIINMLQLCLDWPISDIKKSYKFPAGRKSSVYCDIAVFKDSEIQFVIEAKKGDHKQTEEDLVQLESYISLSKCHIGLYIGEKIQLYYDNPSDTNKSVLILESELTADSVKGIKLFDQLNAKSFSRERICTFCEKIIQEEKQVKSVSALISKLLDNNAEQLKEIITEHFQKNGNYSSEIVNKALSQISFSAQQIEKAKSNNPQTENNKDNEDDTTNIFFLKKPNKNVDARLKMVGNKFYLLSGSKVSQTITNSFRDNDIKRRNSFIENNVEKVSDTVWVVKKDVEYSSPSTPCNDVLGASSNGWELWKSLDGKMMGVATGYFDTQRKKDAAPKSKKQPKRISKK